MSDAWELLTRWPGGTVMALAALTDASGEAVLAATAAGLHISRDGGRTWRWIQLGPSPVVTALVASPAFERDGALLAGTERGLFRSSDGGRTWQAVVSGSGIPALALAPEFATTGLAFAGTAADGLLRSEDAGKIWAGASAGLLDLSVTAAAI